MSKLPIDEAFEKMMEMLEDEAKTKEDLIYDEYAGYAAIITHFVLKHLFKKDEFSEKADGEEVVSRILEFDNDLRAIIAKTHMPEHQILLELLAVAEKFVKKYN